MFVSARLVHYNITCRLRLRSVNLRNQPLRSISTRASSPTRSARFPSPLFVLPTAAIALVCGSYLLERSKNVSGATSHICAATDVDARSTLRLIDMAPAQYNLATANIQAAQDELTTLLTADRVITDLKERLARSSTQWSPVPDRLSWKPHLIVQPESTEEVSAIAKICYRRRIPMIAFAGGTSLEGALAAAHGGVCIDFARMKDIVIVHPQDMDVVVQPGVSYTELNQALANLGFFFPPDPGPGAQIGGMVSQGCSGTNSYRYGTMRDWVLGLTVVLADGTVIRTRHRPRKSSAGYNLTQLIIGSEGTLGIVTEATLKITRKPENVTVALASFPTTYKAVEVAVKVVQSDMPLAAMELLDGASMRAVNSSGYCHRAYDEVPTLFLKFTGPLNIVQDQVDQVKKFAQDSSCKIFEVAASENEAQLLWDARKTFLWSMLAMKASPQDGFLSTDVAVPMSRLADIIEETQRRLQENGLVGACLGHVGDGNFHTAILYPARDEQKAREVVHAIQRQGISMEGTISGEHGIGLENRDSLVEELGEPAIDAMRGIKMALDPHMLLNPDKVFRLNIAKNGKETAR